MFLNTSHQLIEYSELFKGTINAAAVYPREVAKKALQKNAAAIIIAHNHPSGNSEPSAADQNITKHLEKALRLFDISLLDHFVIGKNEQTSFAERGLL
jgi:DNA repair protein RadC